MSQAVVDGFLSDRKMVEWELVMCCKAGFDRKCTNKVSWSECERASCKGLSAVGCWKTKCKAWLLDVLDRENEM